MKTEGNTYKRADWIALALLALLAAVMLFNNLSRETIPTYDESRNSYADYVMLNNKDVNIFTPDSGYLKHRYQVKPPLKSWIKYPLYKIFGFNLFTMRMLDAFMALVTVLLTFEFGRRLFNRWVGLIAGVMLLTTDAIYLWWSRSNQYDSGFIMAALLFFFLFYFYFEDTKWGWLACGVTLAFAFMFKHIQIFLLLAVAGAYLIHRSGFKSLFVKKVIGMGFLSLALPALWVIPFQLKNPDFLGTFAKVELLQRVFTGYGGKARSPIFYLDALDYLGNWLLILPVALIFGWILFFKNKKDKRYLFITIWIWLPALLLALAKFKSWRYLYFMYPAMGILIGVLMYYLYRFVRENSGKWKKYALPAGTGLFTVFVIFQIVHGILFTSNLEQKEYDVFLRYFNREGTELIVSRLNRNDFERAEYLHLFCTENKSFTGEEIQKIIPRLEAGNAILMSRKDYMQALTRNEIDLKSGVGLLYFNFSCPQSFTANTPKEKIAVFRKDSGVADYLGKKNIRLYPVAKVEDSVDYFIKNHEEFLDSISMQILGYPLSVYARDHYLQRLMTGRLISRKELVDEFCCVARRMNYHYRIYNQYNGVKQGFFGSYQTYRFYHLKNSGDNITALGINYSDFEPQVVCELYKALASWNWKKKAGVKEIAEELIKLKYEGALIIKRCDYEKAAASLNQEQKVDMIAWDFRYNPLDKIKDDDLLIVFRWKSQSK